MEEGARGHHGGKEGGSGVEEEKQGWRQGCAGRW